MTRLGYTFNQGEGNDDEILAIVDLKAVSKARNYLLIAISNCPQGRTPR